MVRTSKNTQATCPSLHKLSALVLKSRHSDSLLSTTKGIILSPLLASPADASKHKFFVCRTYGNTRLCVPHSKISPPVRSFKAHRLRLLHLLFFRVTKLVRFAAHSSRQFFCERRPERKPEHYGPTRFLKDHEHCHCREHTGAGIARRQIRARRFQRRWPAGF